MLDNLALAPGPGQPADCPSCVAEWYQPLEFVLSGPSGIKGLMPIVRVRRAERIEAEPR